MDKKKAICEYLRKNHIGKENAIHSKELEKLFLLDGRNIRRKISALRQDGFPICSDETGYYYADNQKEINTTVYRLNELVTKVSNARTGLLFASILGENGRFFKMYMYTALAPVPLSAFAGEPTQNIGKSFMKSYASVCLEGAIIVLACIIFSVFASSPPVVDPNAAPASMVWSYIGELIFNMLILVGAVKMADRLVKEMMGI